MPVMCQFCVVRELGTFKKAPEDESLLRALFAHKMHYSELLDRRCKIHAERFLSINSYSVH